VSRPTLTFIAGANGSGKTTLTRWNPDIFKQIPVLDPDAVVNTLQATASQPPIAAARQVLACRSQALGEKRKFRGREYLGG
jgi:predicted ABC-type ATPase